MPRLLTFICALMGTVALTAGAAAGGPGSVDGRIAFDGYDRDSDSYEIYSMLPNGKDRVNLTNDFGADAYSPVYSPDGRWVAFNCEERVDRDNLIATDVCIVRDGGGIHPVRLTGFDGDEGRPSFSPDGKYIVFTGRANKEPAAIYVMKRSGKGLTQLTKPGDFHNILGPAFSPDGQRIMFTTFDGGNGTVHLMNTDGSNVVTVIDPAAFESAEWPSFSPDGTRILFLGKAVGEPDREVWSTDLAGGAAVRLSDNKVSNEIYPSWSPNGDLVAYQSGGRHQVFTARADGTDIQVSIDDTGFNLEQPAFAPAGDRIVFSMKHFGDSEIGIAAPGNATKRLTRTNRIHEGSPDWGRRG